MSKHPYFEKIRDRWRERMLAPIRPDAGKSFQKIISKAEENLHRPGARELFEAISKLSEGPDDGTYEVSKADGRILRSALESVWAGCDARIRAGIAYDAAHDKAPNVRARAWADEYGMEFANRAVETGDRTALNQLLAYVQHIYENTGEGTDPTNASREERLRAVEYIRKSFKLASSEAAIGSLFEARKNNYVIEKWDSALLPLDAILIPGRR